MKSSDDFLTTLSARAEKIEQAKAQIQAVVRETFEQEVTVSELRFEEGQMIVVFKDESPA